MPNAADLDTRLRAWAGEDPKRGEVAATLCALAGAAATIARLVGEGALAGPMSQATGIKSGCDDQKTLDLVANDALIAALKGAPVALLASEEMREPLELDCQAPLLVAVDPIDGSSNIDANFSIGTIFSILPAVPDRLRGEAFLVSGRSQNAAGFCVYGPATTLALTYGEGTDVYTLDRAANAFRLTAEEVTIPALTSEFAINVSNRRHWDEAIRTYVDDCLEGRNGPRGRDFNMRWTASPVADVNRIVARGGIFLYPRDLRSGYRNGRLRLVYEANPLAFVIEQAGGAASTGRERVLDLVPSELHQHVPFIAGSRSEVEVVERLISGPAAWGERSPLFRRRGLLSG